MRQPATASAASAFISIININRVKAKKERQSQAGQYSAEAQILFHHHYLRKQLNFNEKTFLIFFIYFETKFYIYCYKNIFVVRLERIKLHYIHIICMYIIYAAFKLFNKHILCHGIVYTTKTKSSRAGKEEKRRSDG